MVINQSSRDQDITTFSPSYKLSSKNPGSYISHNATRQHLLSELISACDFIQLFSLAMASKLT